MKKNIIICIFLLPQLLFSQPEICDHIYLWPFVNDKGEKTTEADLLLNEVEAALTQISDCVVLQRRKYSTLSSQIENEIAIQSVEGISETLDRELQTFRAKIILFGMVNKDFSGNISLQLSFQNLMTKQILLQNAMFLIGREAQNSEQRRKKIRQFVTACVNPGAIDEELFWENTVETNTKDAYVQYLNKYPAGKFRSEADRVINDEYLWSQILNHTLDKERIKLLEDYKRRRYERHAEEANDMLQDLLWQNNKLKKYQSLYPNGKYAERVEDKRRQRKERLGGILDLGMQIGAQALAESREKKAAAREQKTLEDKKPIGGNTETQGIETITSRPGSVKIVQRGRSTYNGYYLYLSSTGRITLSSKHNSGCDWKLEPISGNTYRIKNLGNGVYKDYYLRLNADGKVIPSKEVTSGCIWELVPVSGSKYYLKNQQRASYKGYYLRYGMRRGLYPAKSIVSTCVWEVQ